jgi:hypothetical protein
MKFCVTTNGSKFDEKIHIAFPWPKIVPNSRPKREKPLNAVLAAKPGDGFFVILEKAVSCFTSLVILAAATTPLRDFEPA